MVQEKVTLTPSDIGATSNTEFNEHLEENIALTTRVIRDTSLVGAQTIDLFEGKTLHYCEVICWLNGTRKMSRIISTKTHTTGYYQNSNGDVFLTNNVGVVLEDTIGNNTVAFITFEKDKVTLNWVINGNGAGVNSNNDNIAQITINCIYHGEGKT
ncbi:hypothetical protein [Lysinibacillus sphaericus]|uniref:hypothetical protein n=1 Tax=Lysinibacillus sphaericus TaxID=1421 RepID=UPI003D01F549